MYKIYKNILITILGLLFHFACTSNEPTAPADNQTTNYFPNRDGTTYHFEITEFDSTGALRTGSRQVLYYGDTLINGTTYQLQKDSITIGSEMEKKISVYRKSENGVFYFIDTSGFSVALPDTLRNRITITPEMQSLLLLLGEGSFWQVFNVTIELQPGIIYAPYKITANFIKEENILLHLISGDRIVTAQKIKYDLEFRFDPEEPARYFTSYSWVADNIGIIKMEGNAILVNTILSGEINLDNSSKSVTYDIINYNIP